MYKYICVATDSTCIFLFILPQPGSLCSFKLNIYTLFSQYQLNIYCFVAQYYLNMYIFVVTLTIKTVHLNVNKDDMHVFLQVKYYNYFLLTSNPKCFLHHFRPSIIGISTLHLHSMLLTRRQGNCIWGLRWPNVFILLPTSRWMKCQVCKCFRFSR